MLTVDEVKKSISKVRLEGTRLNIMSYIRAKDSQDKIFTKKDLAKVFDVSSRKIAKSLTWLAEHDMISKIKFGRMTYYGSNEVIKRIEKKIEKRGDINGRRDETTYLDSCGSNIRKKIKK